MSAITEHRRDALRGVLLGMLTVRPVCLKELRRAGFRPGEIALAVALLRQDGHRIGGTRDGLMSLESGGRP